MLIRVDLHKTFSAEYKIKIKYLSPFLLFSFQNKRSMRPFIVRIFTLFLVIQCFKTTAQEKWTPARMSLTTPWTSKVSPDYALPEYPRPQMVRPEWRNLNGLWDFTLFDRETEKVVKQTKILVPYPVESALSGIGWKVEPKHAMIYHRKVSIPSKWQGQRILLHFGAVDWKTEVTVNGKKAGEHEGGYDPFTFDITDFLTGAGEQDITVQVSDPTDTGGQPIGKQRLQPNGIWYTATSGIWQTVWMEPVPAAHIRSYRVEPDLDKSRIFVRVETGGDMNDYKVVARVRQDGRVLSHSAGKVGTPLMLRVTDPHVWSTTDPYLYDLEVTIENTANKAVDKVTGYFGMRKISLGKDANGFTRLLLNNEPLFQLGPLDQGFWPDGLYTPPTEEAMVFDLETLQSMGFNMIRKHVKVEPERWYYLCDKMGFLVWQDMPSAGNESAEDRQHFKWELKAVMDALFNHPSIIVWVPFNEGWGQHDTEFYVEKLKEWDPTRLVNNASGWTDKGVGDMMDIHDYPGPSAPAPEQARASVLGEFGGLGLNVQGHQWTKEGWGYQLIDSPEALLERYEELYRELLPLEQSAGLSAAIYTQVSDIETENNGLMTYDRKVIKMDPGLIRLTHNGQMPPKPTNHAYIFHKNISIPLQCVKPGASIQYAIEGKKTGLTWKPYTGPLTLRKNATIACKAIWPDSTQSHTQRYTFTKVKAIPAGKGPKSPAPGLSVKVYEGSWDQLPDFKTLTPAETLTTSQLSLNEIKRSEDFAAVFEGWIEAPETGVYTFHLRSDDGSRLLLGNKVLIDNDGIHGMRGGNGSLVLKKGLHFFRLEFFQKKGGVGLEIWMDTAQGSRQTMKWVH